MGKYAGVQDDIFSIFASQEWINEGIKTMPALITPKNAGQEFIRVSIIPSGSGFNTKSASGLLIIDIFAERVKGPGRVMQIADILDRHLSAKSLKTASGGSTQLMGSSLGNTSTDKDDPALGMTSYSIAFNYFGVQ